MSQETDKSESQSLQHAAEHEQPPRKPLSVMSYLAILFAAAFLLMLLSYFMQQRKSEEVISGLKNSVSAMQSIEELQTTNETLKTQVDDQQSEITRLESQNTQLEEETAALQNTEAYLEKQLNAMDWFWRIQREYSRGRAAAAGELVAAFQASGLPGYLPTTNPADPEGLSPAKQYEALLTELG